jgi:hypothetical protein
MCLLVSQMISSQIQFSFHKISLSFLLFCRLFCIQFYFSVRFLLPFFSWVLFPSVSISSYSLHYSSLLQQLSFQMYMLKSPTFFSFFFEMIHFMAGLLVKGIEPPDWTHSWQTLKVRSNLNEHHLQYCGRYKDLTHIVGIHVARARQVSLISCVSFWLMFGPGLSVTSAETKSSVNICGLNDKIPVAINPDVTYDGVI